MPPVPLLHDPSLRKRIAVADDKASVTSANELRLTGGGQILKTGGTLVDMAGLIRKSPLYDVDREVSVKPGVRIPDGMKSLIYTNSPLKSIQIGLIDAVKKKREIRDVLRVPVFREDALVVFEMPTEVDLIHSRAGGWVLKGFSSRPLVGYVRIDSSGMIFERIP